MNKDEFEYRLQKIKMMLLAREIRDLKEKEEEERRKTLIQDTVKIIWIIVLVIYLYLTRKR